MWDKSSNIYDNLLFGITVLFALATNLSTGVTSTCIVLSTLVFIAKCVRLHAWPRFDLGICKAIGMYLFMFGITTVASQDFENSMHDFFATAYRFIPLFMAMLCISTQKQLKIVIVAFAVSLFVNDLYGIWQFVQNDFVLDASHRIRGFNNHPVLYCDFMLMGMVVMFYACRKSYFLRWQRYAFVCIGMLSLACMLLSYTRGAWVAFVGLCVVIAVLHKSNLKKNLTYILIGIFSIVVLAYSVPVLHDRVESIFSTKHPSNHERLLMWNASWEMFKDYPITGVGPDEFKYYYNTQYIPETAVEKPQNGDWRTGHGSPHNMFFKVLSEGGMIGLTGYLFFNIYLLYRLYRDGKKSQITHSLAYMGFLVMLAIHLEGLTNANFIQVPCMRECWFFIGIALIGDKVEKGSSFIGRA